MNHPIIPNQAIKYILYQRTGYLADSYLFKLLTALGRYRVTYKLSVGLKVALFGKKIIREFIKDMDAEFETLRPFLPAAAASVLDIGCGLAGVDLFISEHYRHQIKVYLLDKTQIDKTIYYNFEERGSFYSSLDLAKSILTKNGVAPENVITEEATADNRINFQESFDLIISLISWGFHYPVATYLDEAYDKLKPGGLLIIDVRSNKGGEQEVSAKFGNCQTLFSTEKYLRILARK